MSVLDNIRTFFVHIGQGFHSSLRHSHRNDNGQRGRLAQAGPPRTSLNRRQSVAAESFDPEKDTDFMSEESKPVYPKTDDQRARLGNALKEILLFRCLDEEQKSHIIDAMQEKCVKANEIVISQGDDGDNFYVIESGTYDIYVRAPNNPPGELGKKVGAYVDHGSFGELALMYNTSRAATIKAVTDGILWFMDRNTFRRIVLKAAFLKRQLYENLLEEVPLLKELSTYERVSVADALQSRVYNDKATIISQGEPGKEMFFIESGAVRVVVREKNKEVEVNKLEKGAYFGELALIAKKPRAASVYAVGKTQVAVLDVASFERLMGPCRQVMQRNFDTYEKQLKELLGPDYQLRDKASR